MNARVVMQWHLRQVMATRGIYQTSELVPLLAERGLVLSRQYVHKLVTQTPQRLNMDILAVLCDVLDCEPNDLLEPVVQAAAPQPTGTAGSGPGIGDLRPIRAQLRRPNQ